MLSWLSAFRHSHVLDICFSEPILASKRSSVADPVMISFSPQSNTNPLTTPLPPPPTSAPAPPPQPPKPTWEWKNDHGGWTPYDAPTQTIIETGYQVFARSPTAVLHPSFVKQYQSSFRKLILLITQNQIILNHGFFGQSKGGYRIDFKTSMQTKIATNYSRDIRRTVSTHSLVCSLSKIYQSNSSPFYLHPMPCTCILLMTDLVSCSASRPATCPLAALSRVINLAASSLALPCNREVGCP